MLSHYVLCFLYMNGNVVSGSLWEPNLTWSRNDSAGDGTVITITFNTAQFSEWYRVDIRHPDFHSSLSLTVPKVLSDNPYFIYFLCQEQTQYI